jgi:hypothetical protein
MNTIKRLLIGGALIALCGDPNAFSADGQEKPSSGSRMKHSFAERFELSGRVLDTSLELPETIWSKLESPNRISQSSEFYSMFNARPASHAKVVLRGVGLEMQTTTDSEGRFVFTGLVPDVYDLIAFKGGGNGSQGRLRWRFVPGDTEKPIIEINAHAVTIRGRVLDPAGAPLRGVHVTGSPALINVAAQHHDPDGFEEERERMRRFAISTYSGDDGLYELQGLQPPGIMDIVRYLESGEIAFLAQSRQRGTAYCRALYDISAIRDGYAQRDVTRVPLMTEPMIGAARRLWRVLVRGSADLSEKQKMDFPFIEKGAIPASEGTTIIEVDLILYPADRDAGIASETPVR